MGVSVAEYLGQRTDIDNIAISPTAGQENCPFMNHPCPKIGKGYEPVCSVRKPNGTLWITCEDRLCSTKKNSPLGEYQKEMLVNIASVIFQRNVQRQEVCVKREVRMQVYEGNNYNADYIISLASGRNSLSGPDRLVLEMQGGGETSGTGRISEHVANWKNNPRRTNAMLRSDVPKTGTIETNAWRRQQEQFIVKGNIAMKTWKGLGIAFCVGAPLFDYLMNKLKHANLPDLRNYNWTLALIGISENKSIGNVPGPIPLQVDNERLLFTNYQTFVQALINQGDPSPNAFTGEFVNLDGENVNIPWN